MRPAAASQVAQAAAWGVSDLDRPPLTEVVERPGLYPAPVGKRHGMVLPAGGLSRDPTSIIPECAPPPGPDTACSSAGAGLGLCLLGRSTRRMPARR